MPVPGATGVAAAPAVIVIVRVAVAVNGTSAVSTTWKVSVLEPAVVGVPLIIPVDALNVRPAGSVPPARLSVRLPVPPAVVRVAEYAAPTVPLGVMPLMLGAGLTVMATVLLLFVPVFAACNVTWNDAATGLGAV